MKKILSLLSAAALCAAALSGCKDKKSSSSAVTDSGEIISTGEEYDSEAYADKIREKISAQERSSDAPALGSVGDYIEPDADAQDGDLGAYRECSTGVKLYYEEDEFPTELMLTLERYFTSFATADYALYTQCVYPSYIDNMETFLDENYGYGMNMSFANQCSSLADNMESGFKVTRIKLEPAPEYYEDKTNFEGFFSSIDESFGKDYYKEVADEADQMYDGVFYVMAAGADEEEVLLISEFEIVFAEKDGRYYIFG